MKNLKTIQSALSTMSFLTNQQSISVKGGTCLSAKLLGEADVSSLDGEGEDKRRKRKPAAHQINAA
jgi:hypothetical protein